MWRLNYSSPISIKYKNFLTLSSLSTAVVFWNFIKKLSRDTWLPYTLGVAGEPWGVLIVLE